jgi:acyl-coenzyme A thioesterase PaaI-like protein
LPESLKTRLYRWGFNFYPAYRGTGAWITYIASDWREVRVQLPLSWQTRNYVGTIFGGSIYAAVDPFYMIMLIKNLGSECVVWDKAAAVRFKKPGKSTLYARFVLEETEIQKIKDELKSLPKIDRVFHIDLTNSTGEVHAWVEKTIYLAVKNKLDEQDFHEQFT